MLSTIVAFLHRAIMQGIPLLYGSTGEIMTEKSGNLNLGIPGIMYIGGMSGVIGAFLYENSLSSPDDAVPFLAVIIPLLTCILGSLFAGLIYCFLTVTLRANQNVTGLALTTFGTGFGNFFGGSLIKLTGSDVPSVDRAKYLSTCIGSVIAGFGGLYYVMDYANGVWSNDGFGDRGWLAIALVIFAIWKPNLSIIGSIVFGGLYIVYLYVPGALRTQELYKMIPYVVTIIVLIFVSVRNKKENQGPASLGLSYFREER